MKSNKPFGKHKSKSNSNKNKKEKANNTELSTNTMSSGFNTTSADLDDTKNQETKMIRSPEDDSCHSESEVVDNRGRKESGESDRLLENSEDLTPLPDGWEQHEDNSGPYYWHIATGTIQRIRPSSTMSPRRESYVFYHDDEEINQPHKIGMDYIDNLENSAASSQSFIIYPLGNCEFDETQLTSATSSKAIQRCILQISTMDDNVNTRCWNLDPTKPILMRFHDRKILFFDLETQQLIYNQSIAAIRVWAVNDDNDFAYVVEDSKEHYPMDNCSNNGTSHEDSLLERCSLAPNLRCYIFRSLDDDEMSSKVAIILNMEITKIKEAQNSGSQRHRSNASPNSGGPNDDVEVYPCDHAMIAKYLGYVNLNRPSGIDMLNSAIDKCVAEAEKLEQQIPLKDDDKQEESNINIDCKIHISPSSVIVESCSTGSIIVECRIRFLTFMGISKRDVKWYGFIMQTDENKFQAHCFECLPSAGPVCNAIQSACTNMYKKVIQNLEPETITPSKVSITNALRKTFSKIRLGAVSL